MTKEQQAERDALKLAKEALENTDKDKFPKLYESREATVKAMENYKDQQIRAEQAEDKAKKKYAKPAETGEPTPKNKEEETSKNDYSLQDIRALGDVHDDDVDEVVEYAKQKGIDIAEAKKTPMIQGFLRDMTEKRKTAKATNTGKGKRGTTKISGQDLIRKVDKGEMVEDVDALAEARLKDKEKSR